MDVGQLGHRGSPGAWMGMVSRCCILGTDVKKAQKLLLPSFLEPGL